MSIMTNNATAIDYSNNYHNCWQDDDLRDYLNVLEKAVGKDKYICPVCSGNDLSIGQTGFTCYTGNCDSKEIYKKVKKLAGEWIEHSNNNHSSKPQVKSLGKSTKTSLQKPKYKPVLISEDSIQLAQLPAIPTDIPVAVKPDWIPQWLKDRLNQLGTLDTVEMITYQYSENTWLERYQWCDKSQEKGKGKTFHWGYRNPETGEVKRQKVESVPPYRFSEVLNYAPDESFLAVEGEKCIEACRSIGLVASEITALSKSPQCLESVREKDITIVIIPDKDETGIDKAKKLEQACLEHQVKYLILDVYQWLKDKPVRDDIADLVSELNMNAEEIIEVLNHQIRETLDYRVKNEPKEKPTRQDTRSHISDETEQFLEIPVTRLNKAELIEFIEREYGDSLKFNLRKQQIELDGVPIETSMMHIELAKKHRIESNRIDVKEIFQHIAKENQYDPVKTWFEEIRQKADRGEIQPVAIDNLATRYFGTSNFLYDIYFKKFLISVVARVFNPGCKVDTVPVFKGEQGCGKSTLLQTLGRDYYGSSMSIAVKRNNEADELATASRGFIQEYAEFEDIVSSKKSGDLKGFISRSVDTYRKPYAETPKEYPRNFAIVGTTNEEEFLNDSTGNRRFWVIPVAVDRIDITLLEKEVEGIWASAIDAYLSGDCWHLTELEEEARKRLNQKFQLSDEWENPIGDYLQQLETKAIASCTEPMVTTKELLNLIGQNSDERRSQNRVSKILTLLGWKNLGQRVIKGKRKRVWTNPSFVLNPNEVEQKVEQPETTDTQGLSQPTRPQAQPQERLSTQVVTAPNPSFTEPVVDDRDETSIASSENTELTAKTINEEKELFVCDLAGITLEVGDYIQPSNDESAVKDWEKLSAISNECDRVANNPVVEIIAIERCNHNGTEKFFVVGQLINGVQFHYYLLDNSQQTGSSFLIEKRIRKMVRQDGQWVVATI